MPTLQSILLTTKYPSHKDFIFTCTVHMYICIQYRTYIHQIHMNIVMCSYSTKMVSEQPENLKLTLGSLLTCHSF